MVEELQRVFGHNLRAFRVTRGLSRKQLGELMGGYGEAYVGAIERGDRNLTFQTAAHLCQLAGADLFELLVPPDGWNDLRAAASGRDPEVRPTRRQPKRPAPAPSD